MNTESYALARFVRPIARAAFNPRTRRTPASPVTGALIPALERPERAWAATHRGGVLAAQLYWAAAPRCRVGPAATVRSTPPRHLALTRAGTVLLCGALALALAATARAATPDLLTPPKAAPSSEDIAAHPAPRLPDPATQRPRPDAAPAKPRPRRAATSRPQGQARPAARPHRERSDAPSPAAVPGSRSWPVGARPRVVRGWEPPATDFGPGHRGVDLSAPEGTTVRAAASGRVSFAGPVAGRGVVAIELADSGDPPLRITYEPVRPLVRVGDEVVAGQPVAVLGSSTHCPHSCLHWGLLRGKEYLNPLSLLPEWMLHRRPSRLLPVAGVPEPSGSGRAAVSAARPATYTGATHRPHAAPRKQNRTHPGDTHAATRSAGRTGPADSARGRPASTGPRRERGRARRGRLSRGRRRGPSPRSPR
ncbi:peptidoglycan DD-metalloendopeptidase family protein [Streptomyces sp. NPDC058373]|uniref:peptidoglycan DD-metalloendopeptidase family protein n=1 Tax=Streptomyces sp. NPDC058373 TaxID=3346465 RepID=UPI0036685EAC